MNLFLLLCIFSISIEQSPEQFDLSGQPKSYTGSGTKIYSLSNPSFNQEYMHVSIKNKRGKNPYAILSKDDQTCKEHRLLLGMNPFNNTVLFIKRNQIQGGTFYLCVHCLQGDSCEYEINVKYEESAKLQIGEQYSYYVTEGNTNMKFDFQVKQGSQDTNSNPYSDNQYLRNLASVNAVFNFWVKGENLAVTHSQSLKEYSFSHGKLFYVKYNSGDSYQITINAQVGSYINVGSIEINDGVAKALRVNDFEIMAVLVKNELKEICFPTEKRSDIDKETDVVYINGLVFTKKLKTYYKNNGAIDEYSDKEIIDGNIVEGLYHEDYKSPKLYCTSFNRNDTKDHVIFSLQLSANSHIQYNQLIYPPQYNGVIYPHFLMKNELAIFQGAKITTGAKEINYNMKAIMGYPDMLFDNCTTFPDCHYTEDKLNGIIDPHHSNRMSVYSYYLKEKKEVTPISAFQPLLIVKCRGGNVIKNRTSDFCIYETAIFSDQDRLKIKETETFSQFLLKGEKDLYTVNFETEENVEKVYLDVIVFSGDVRFEIDDDNKNNANKYFLANKIFYSVRVGYSKKIDFSVSADKNSFYTISYQLVKKGDASVITNVRESGVNFVESISIGEYTEDSKYIFLQNFKIDVGTPFLASFYSKNCKFIVSRENDPHNITYLDMYGEFGQVLIDENDPYYFEDKYIFKIKALGNDVSAYDKKLCMIYISGVELENTNTGGQRTISLSENVPHSFIFTQKYHTISYSYHLGDRTNPVVIDFNLIDKSDFNVEILFDYFTFQNTTIFRNTQIFIYSEDLHNHCPEDEVCTINVVIKLANKEATRKRVETTFTQVFGAPTYLQKNRVKQDIIVGDLYKFYYLDIGAEEMGDITINYKRNSGNIFAKIVKKTQVQGIADADWRGIYKFPKDINESLPYEAYLKKIVIDREKTKECADGCYLLITVRSSNIREEGATEKSYFIPYRITITPRIIPSSLQVITEIPKVRIPVNEYIIGNIEVTDHELYYYYEVTLPFESDYVIIDWQADYPILLINIGPESPTMNHSHFKFNTTQHDTIIKISKQEILQKSQEHGASILKNDSIKFFNLTLGIYTQKIDSLYTSVYSFKIFMPPTYKPTVSEKEREAFELIHIRSDQKVQCDPGDQLVCLFAVIFDDGDITSNLTVFPKAHDTSAEVHFMADLVDSEQIERNDIKYIVEHMPTVQGKYNSNDGKKFIFIEKMEKKKCLLLLVSVDTHTIIEVYSSTSRDYVTTPNPSTPQIFALQDKGRMYLGFQTTQDLLINIVCVSGEGYFYWEDEEKQKYHLLGYDDRITLTTRTNKTDAKLSHLIAEQNVYSWMNDEKSGFVFYITYYPRNAEYNIDQVKPGRSTEFNYRHVKFPINFYTPLKDNDVAVSFNFYKNYINNEIKDMRYNGPLFKIWGKIITEEEAYLARIENTFKPHKDNLTIYGSCDGPFGTILLNTEEINKFGIPDKTPKALFFSVELTDNKTHSFSGSSLEVSVLKEQTTIEKRVFSPENVYLSGKLGKNELFDVHYFRYKLKSDPHNPYMLIEFSAISRHIKWAVSTSEYDNQNATHEFKEWETKRKDGRDIVVFKVPDNVINNTIYLIIYNEDKKKIDKRLANFVFKYMNGNNKNNFFGFEIKNPNITVKNDTTYKEYTLTFSPALEQEADMAYYVKGIYKDGYIPDEAVSSLAISESNGTYLHAYNPPKNADGKIELKLQNVGKELIAIKVLAKANSDAINIYAAYNPVIFGSDVTINPNEPPKQNPKPHGKNKSLGIIIGIMVALVVIVVVIIVVVVVFNQKNKHLIDKVNQISFADENNNNQEKSQDLLTG